MIQHLTEIVEEARKKGKKRLAVAYGQDSHTLAAVYEAYKEGLVEPTLYGDKAVIEQGLQRERSRYQRIQHRARTERHEVRTIGRGIGRSGQCRRIDERSCFDRQIHARNSEQGGWPVPTERRAEPRLDRRDALLPQTARHFRRSRDSAARLQAEDETDRLLGTDGQPAWHQNAENRLHRPVGTAATQRHLVDRRRSAGQDGRPRSIG